MNYLKIFSILTLALFTFTQCQTDDTLSATGNLQFEITDAPIDDTNVKGVFVTVAEVKVDGKTFSGFSGKTTIDIKAYQNGRTEILGLGELEAGSYNNISLVLDYETDASGNSPGCYVLTTNDTKEELAANSETEKEISIQGNFSVAENATTTIVADFDLRKAVAYEGNNEQKYSFANDAKLNTSIRLVNKSETGTIKGNCSDDLNRSEKIIVYAYAQGEYNQSTETDASGNENFANSVTSAQVDAQGNYQLSFLEAGNYELVFVSYEDVDNDGTFQVNGTLSLLLDLGITLDNVEVGANSEVTLNAIVTGILPL